MVAFEEVKKLMIESVDNSNDINDLIQTVIDKIYLKGVQDDLNQSPDSEVDECQ